MPVISKIAKELFDYERSETPGELLFFRLFELFIVYSAIAWVWKWGLYILRISDLVLPLGIANYVDVSVFFNNGSSLVIAGLTTLFLLMGMLRVTKYAYMISFLLLHLQFATRYTLGEIPHSSNIMGMTVLAFATAAFVFPGSSPAQSSQRRRFTMGYTYFFVGLGYTLAAVCKLIATGPTWSDGRHLWIWVHEKAVDSMGKSGLLEYNWLQEFALSNYFFATTILTFGLLSELFAWLMWWRKLRTPVVLAVMGLHLGIFGVMNIMFWHTFWELLLLAFPWAVWLDKLLGNKIDKLTSIPLFAR